MTRSPLTPTSVTVIGGLFAAGSTMMLLSGGMMLFTFAAIRWFGPDLPPLPHTPVGFSRILELMLWMISSFGVIAALQILLGAAVLTVAVNFLRLRAWARTALEAIAWMMLIFSVAGGVLLGILLGRLTSDLPAPEGGVSPGAILEFGTIGGILVLIVQAVPLIVMLKCLRGRTIRDAVMRRG